MTDSPASVKYLFSNYAFVLFLISRFCNVTGVQILTVAVGWHVYQLTHDPMDLGYIGLAQFAPSYLLFVVAGYVSDRYDRRATLVVSNLVDVMKVIMRMNEDQKRSIVKNARIQIETKHDYDGLGYKMLQLYKSIDK